MKKFINFLESLKDEDNVHLVDVILEGYNSCFEVSYTSDIFKDKIKKSEGYSQSEWENELNTKIEKGTKKYNIDNFRHHDFDNMYNKDFSVGKAYGFVKKELDIPDKKPKVNSDFMQRMGVAGSVSPPFKVAHQLMKLGKGLRKK